MLDIVLYRKYRPDKFSEVLGQDHIVKVLESAIKDKNVAHAYLFAGSRGTGKTSVARILAHEIGTTDNDIQEIDAASNRGIDDIRELREGVSNLPFESKYKVYIIDEVHMLTKDAFNALLKTLEEPPKHVIFILATTEVEKLPETIVSRCQSFNFKKPTQAILKELVIEVGKKEGYTVEPASAELIALLGEGSFRDTHGVLQKVITSISGKKINLKDVEEVTGAPNGQLVNSVIDSIADGNTGKGLQTINDSVEQNVDMSLFTKMVLQKLRAILLLRFAENMKKTIEEDFTEEDFKWLSDHAKDSKTITSKTIIAFLEAHEQIRFATISHLPLELALISLTDTNT